MYRQPVCRIIGNDVWSEKRREITLRHQAKIVIWANQKTKSFLYRCLCALAMFDVTCFPAFVGASDIILSVLARRTLTPVVTSFCCCLFPAVAILFISYDVSLGLGEVPICLSGLHKNKDSYKLYPSFEYIL